MSDDSTNNIFIGRWIGDVRGNEIGMAFAESTLTDNKLIFELRVNSAGRITIFDCELDKNDTKRMLVRSRADGAAVQTGEIQFDTISNEKLSGRWSLSSGAAGVIWLNRADTSQQVGATVSSTPSAPIELIAKEEKLPNIVLYRKEIEAIVLRLNQLIPPPAKVVVTAVVDGQTVTQYSEVFFSRTDLPSFLREIKLNITNSAQPFSRSILVVLSATEPSKFFIQSDDGIWTNGAYAILRDISSRYISRMTVVFQRHGLNLNGLVFLAALVMLPSLSIIPRIIFMLLIVVFLTAFKKMHDAINRTTVYLDDTRRLALAREFPTILSTLIAAMMVWAASWLFQFLSSDSFKNLIATLFH